MFTIYKDYIIKKSDVPVFTLRTSGLFEPKDCLFMEFFIAKDDENLKKIKMLCEPFVFNVGIQNKIVTSGSVPGNIQRLFLLAGSDIIINNFTKPDDCLAFALCDDGQKDTEIQYFEVNYKFKRSYDPNQKYRRVGTSALNALKDVYQNRKLYGKSAMESLNFWCNNGFICTNKHDFSVCWQQR